MKNIMTEGLRKQAFFVAFFLQLFALSHMI